MKKGKLDCYWFSTIKILRLCCQFLQLHNTESTLRWNKLLYPFDSFIWSNTLQYFRIKSLHFLKIDCFFPLKLQLIRRKLNLKLILTPFETWRLLAPTTADVERDGILQTLFATGRTKAFNNILEFFQSFWFSNKI